MQPYMDDGVSGNNPCDTCIAIFARRSAICRAICIGRRLGSRGGLPWARFLQSMTDLTKNVFLHAECV